VAKFRGSDYHKSGLESPKLIEQRDAVTDAPRQPVETVDEELVNASAANYSKQPVQAGTIERRSGVPVVVETFRQQRPTVFAL